ncbi:hypothetical protein VPNG_10393 [Cytospora leucostoma]|uniref:C2H2-type domain-containing protein n=1 Tax=Cytospora leucostoma TaxID=1230097 RepID=A0A423VB28_9PEZI|nr:hypothetical protein VPNG_10393 [Cytospora leucostoma]
MAKRFLPTVSLLARRSLPSTLQPYSLGLRLHHRSATECPAAVTVTSTSQQAGVVFGKTPTGAVEQGIGISNIPVVTAGSPTNLYVASAEGETGINSIKETGPARSGVAILWDLDNKPPSRSPPFIVAQRLRQVIEEKYGAVKVLAAYGNKSTLHRVPQWAIDEARIEFKATLLDEKENEPADLYRCNVCGAKCRTLVKLQKHVKTLHERDRRKKVNHISSKKKGSKKREKLQTRYAKYLGKYKDAADGLVPQVRYDLEEELTRAMVEVKMVGDHAEAADAALKQHASKLFRLLEQDSEQETTIDCLVLVSDDTGFKKMLHKGRRAGVKMVQVGHKCALRRSADEYISWDSV